MLKDINADARHVTGSDRKRSAGDSTGVWIEAGHVNIDLMVSHARFESTVCVIEVV
jgi:hypothetical protein